MDIKPGQIKIRGKLPSSPQSMKYKNRCYRYNVGGCEPSTPTKPDERKNQSALTQNEKDAFIAAYNTINTTGALGEMVAHHADMTHMMHASMGPDGIQRFLPWHRVYLSELEEILQAAGGDAVTIPYWDWTVDQAIPGWIQAFTPTVIGVSNPNVTFPVVVTRNPGGFPTPLPTQQDVSATMSHNQYTPFTHCLEAGRGAPPSGSHNHVQSFMHNGGHVWVGGTMMSVPTAPADPIFWMHHANIDRIWDLWQKQNPGLNPTLSPPMDTMDPWTVNEPQTRDTLNFGYVYV
jgi:tyrosinase